MRACCIALLASGAILIAAAPSLAAPGETPPKPVRTETIRVPGAPGDSAAGEPEAELPPVSADEEALPEPVRRMRRQILEAARSGDIAQLKIVIQSNELPPSLPTAEGIRDPIEALKAVSGDPEGREILAIMIDVLETGYAHVGIGTPQEMYVWPYFAHLPFDALTPAQEVDLYRIITPGDREGMEIYGQYTFFRLGIGPDGVWHYFLTSE